MKLLRFSAIYVILLMTVVGLASCDTTRRASRRIRNIVNEHPELLSQDTMQCDLNVSVTPPSDSTTFSLSDFNNVVISNNDKSENDTCSNETPAVITPPSITHKTDSGTFTIEKTGEEEFKITYTPDTLQVETTAEVVVPKLVIEEKTTLTLADWLRWGVVFIIAFLFLRLLVLAKK